jgi:hypothetical protein
MKTCLLALAFSLSALPAVAAVPLVNASCPRGITVHADAGGPVFINGRKAALKRFNSSYYEARSGGVTVSLVNNPDGTTDVSYTAKGGYNGRCATDAPRAVFVPAPRETYVPAPREAYVPAPRFVAVPVPMFVGHRNRNPEPDYVYEPQQAPSAGDDVCPVDVSQADRYKYPACN